MTRALNFDTPDCHVIGGCDLYTTKAAGSDKKLYKSIEHSLESQYESLLRLSATLRPPHASSAASALNLARSSPFGPLTQVSSRRTFAYLIATLNASHPDYDFSHLLRPSDFRYERNLKSVMNAIDTTLYNLRPRPAGSWLATSNRLLSPMATAEMPEASGSPVWGPHMWKLINQEMSLKECSVYCYAPEEDPYDGEDGALWSINYFFFNKARKRVCYLYLRGLSIVSHSPPSRQMMSGGGGRRRCAGASKRAKYWLGDRADAGDVETGWDEDDEDDADNSDGEVIEGLDDEVDVTGEVIDDGDELNMGYNDEWDDEEEEIYRSRSMARDVSEDMADAMEV